MPEATERIPAPRVSGFTGTTEVPLYWCAYGPAGAPRVLVLHGGPGADHEYLLPQFLDLAGDFELVFYDQRGGGRSRSDPRQPITWETQVHDLERVIGELVGGAPTIVGYSWGAMLALLQAIDASRGGVAPAPARLALVDPAGLTRAFRAQFEAEFARRQALPEVQGPREALVRSGLRESNPDAYRQRAFELSVAGYFADPRRATDLTAFRVVGRVQRSVWESLGDYDVVRDLHAVRCPAIIVHGRDDPIPLASSEAAAIAMGAELVVLEACGHVPYVERRSELFSTLLAFLKRPAVDA